MNSTCNAARCVISMKNKIMAALSTGLLVLTCSASAHTKQETTAWIITQTQPNAPGLSYSITQGTLIRLLNLSTPLGNARSQHSIPIDKINRITVVHTDKYLSYTLSCAAPCVDAVNEGIDIPEGGQEKSRLFLFEIYRPLDASFPLRMNEALLKLVELHGGKAQLSQKPITPAPEPF